MITPTFVILAAGMGTRLGRGTPKCLTVLDTGETILQRQLRSIEKVFGSSARIVVVVGYQKELVIETLQPHHNHLVNMNYALVNTSKSLLMALQENIHVSLGGVVWLNGDVVFDENILLQLKGRINANYSVITVDTKNVGDEEVKYVTDVHGNLTQLSKVVPLSVAEGESVGINYVRRQAIPKLINRLVEANDGDYFEKGIELTIEKDDELWEVLDITKFGLNAVEIDFISDLEKANETFSYLKGSPKNL